MTDQTNHAPVTGAFTMAGDPRCTCGYRHRSRYGSEARAKLRKHLAKHNATEQRSGS